MGELDRTELTTPDDALVGVAEGLGPKRPPEAKDVSPSVTLLGNRQSLLHLGRGIPVRKLTGANVWGLPPWSLTVFTPLRRAALHLTRRQA